MWSKLLQYAPSCVLVVQIDTGACSGRKTLRVYRPLSFSLCYTTLAATKANKKRRKRTYDSLMKVLWLTIELCLITCLYMTKHHLFTQNSDLISPAINATRSLHSKHYHMTAWPCNKIPPSPLELLKQNLALTWSHVLHVIKFTLFTTQENHSIILEFAHLKFQWFLHPLIYYHLST